MSRKQLVVQKYGGSSVATAKHIQKVAQRVVATKEEGKNVVVVVSGRATGGGANGLLLTSAVDVSGTELPPVSAIFKRVF